MANPAWWKASDPMIKLVVITPGYISHYKPVAMFLKACNISEKEILVATNAEFRPIVEKDGLNFYEFQAWKNCNLGKVELQNQLEEERKILEASYEATRKGMIAALCFQAEHRIHDLFSRLDEIECDVRRILETYRPKLFLSVQLCYNVTTILEKLKVEYVTFVTGNPDQLPRPDQVYGYPFFLPASISVDEEELDALYGHCQKAQQEATQQFCALTGQKIENAFAVASRKMIVYNYPRVLVRHREVFSHEFYIGASCRPCENSPELEARLKQMQVSGKPVVYVSFGTVFSVRGDVLAKVYQALAQIDCHVVVATGVLADEYRPYLLPGWITGEFLPQMLILKYADLLVGHGGNNSITEALAHGVPVVAFPFASDQFFSARAIEENGIGCVCDPNHAGVGEIRRKLLTALGCAPRAGAVSRDIAAQHDKMRAIEHITQLLER